MQSKGFSRVFSHTTVQRHQFFSAQLSLQPNSHIHTGYWNGWSRFPFPSPGDLAGIKPVSCTAGRFFTTEPSGKLLGGKLNHFKKRTQTFIKAYRYCIPASRERVLLLHGSGRRAWQVVKAADERSDYYSRIFHQYKSS